MKLLDFQKVVIWFKASRPHTLGLAVAVILVGSIQVGWENLHWHTLALALFSALGFQLVSNFANDYGDFSKGTDEHRSESYRALSAGNLTQKQVLTAIVVLSMVSLLAVIALVASAAIPLSGKWTMFALGIASILAAITYTMGKRPYGYFALGDVVVFLFFGLVGVLGSYYLQSGNLSEPSAWVNAVVFGALSTSVLNINNMRDSKSDKANGKITIANILGDKAMIYQYALLIIAGLGLLWLCFFQHALFAVVVLFYGIAVWRLLKRLSVAQFNACLALTVKTTLLLGVLIFVLSAVLL